MKKAKFIVFSALAILPLVGCGATGVTTTSPNPTIGPANQTVTQAVNEPPAPSMPPKKVFTFETEGMTESVDGTWYESTNQMFGMYVLAGYKARAEEPGQDIVTFDNNPDASMRISIHSSEEAKGDLEESIKTSLSSVSTHVQLVDSPALKQNTYFDSAVVFNAQNTTTSETVFLMWHHGTPIVVDMTVPTEMEDTVPFIVMLNSIQLN